MTDFQHLIQNLRNDLRSIPSTGECAIEPSPKPMMDKKEDPGSGATLVPEEKSKYRSFWFRPWVKNYVLMLTRHGFLSAEILIFFLILLSVMRPSFLYHQEKVKEGNEMVRTRFSLVLLLIYSVSFTAMIHIMMYIQKRTLQYLIKIYC